MVIMKKLVLSLVLLFAIAVGANAQNEIPIPKKSGAEVNLLFVFLALND